MSPLPRTSPLQLLSANPPQRRSVSSVLPRSTFPATPNEENNMAPAFSPGVFVQVHNLTSPEGMALNEKIGIVFASICMCPGYQNCIAIGSDEPI